MLTGPVSQIIRAKDVNKPKHCPKKGYFNLSKKLFKMPLIVKLKKKILKQI